VTYTVLFGALAVLVIVAWLLRRNERVHTRRQARSHDIDWDELQAAEREVQQWDASVRPEEDVPGADWGPGTGKPRPPELL
jgi:hypothetical protein